jgi:hypothetical protein
MASSKMLLCLPNLNQIGMLAKIPNFNFYRNLSSKVALLIAKVRKKYDEFNTGFSTQTVLKNRAGKIF